MLGYYSQYSYAPANAFAAATDHLATIKSQINTDLGIEAKSIFAIDIRSASAFTVTLSDETKLTAMKIGDTYVVRFAGMITKCVFSANTTATSVWCAWGRA